MLSIKKQSFLQITDFLLLGADAVFFDGVLSSPPYFRKNKFEQRNRGMRDWTPVVVFSLCSGMVFPKVITKILRTFLNFPFQYGE